MVPAVAITACSGSAQTEDTYSVVDTYSEIALAPDGSRCAIQSVASGINTVLVANSDFSSATLVALPEKNFWVRDVYFGDNANSLLFTAGSPTFGAFETNIHIYHLDLASLGVRSILTGSDFNRAPTLSPDGRKMAFAARSNGGASLFVYEMDLATGTVAPYSPAAFQSIWRMAYRPEGTLVVGGVPGLDPFHSLKIDEANGFQRVFLLGRNGTADPSPFMGLRANRLDLHGAHDDQLLLTARYDDPSGSGTIRFAIMEGDLAAHRFVDFPEMNGYTATGAAIARRNGLMAARGVHIAGVDGAGLVAIKGRGSAVIPDIASQASRLAVVL